MIFMHILDAQRVHIVGIGGIGVSGLAKILAHRGVALSGSDAEASATTDDLRTRGIEVSIGHDASNLVAGIDAVVYSGAVPESNPELALALERGLPCFTYSQALGEVTKKYRTLAVSGTHGKSTTTAMLGTILQNAGLDPLILVGTKVPAFDGGNVHLGSGEFFVVEACEHAAQMMDLSPERIIVTNLEPDHLDFYQTFERLQGTFREYVSRVAPEMCIVNGDQTAVRDLFHNSAIPHTFGFGTGTIQCVSRNNSNGLQIAELRDADGNEFELKLRIPGAFNVMNAMAAFEMARSIGVDPQVALDALYSYPGSWRRFERVGQINGVDVISDYAHHPTAIRETLQATREFFPEKRVVLVYQPHQHHRTKALFDDFVDVLSTPDALILNEVYHVKGRENAEDAGATSAGLIADVKQRRGDKPHWYAQSLDEVSELIRTHTMPNDVVVVMGAGDIYKVAHDVCSK